MKTIQSGCIGPSVASTGRSLTKRSANCDWLPKNTAALLSHPDEGLRNAASKQAIRIAQGIADHAYTEKLLELVERKLPPGIAMSDYRSFVRSSADLPLTWLDLSWSDLRERAKETAERHADDEVKWIIYSWAFNNANPCCADHGADFGSYAQMLVAALKELNNANDASDCVMVWMRLRAAGPPTDWRAVQTLIRGNDNLAVTVSVPF